jgi:protein SCO1
VKRFLLSLVAVLAVTTLYAGNTNQLDNISFNPPLGAMAPVDLPFIDEAGVSTSIGSILSGKPGIIVPVYYECPSLCTLSLNGLLKASRALRLSAGKDFTVIAVSINPKDTPELATAKRDTYRKGYSRPGAEAGWRFLTGTQASIDALTNAIGFKYVYDMAKEQYGHASSLVILTPSGKISRGLNGPEFEARDLKLALIEAGEGKVGTVVERAITYCFSYDGSTGMYSMQIMKVVRVAGAFTALLILFFVGIQIWRERRHSLHAAGGVR